jgi:hypothetical protein
MEEDDRPGPQDADLTECAMCHQRVPPAQTMTLGGRVLCFGCAGGWFDDEGDDES